MSGRRPRVSTPLAVVALLATLARTAAAGGGAATDSYDGIGHAPIDVHGLVDLYVQHDVNQPASEQTQLRAFDGQAEQPSLGMLRLTFAHAPDPIGFRLDAGVGDIPNGYLRFDPAGADYPALSRALSYAEQAFVTATIPLGRGLSVDVGKFGTPVGLEDNEADGNWNYSRSLLYLLAEPSYHVGLRLTYPVAETLAVSVFWLNGWDANLLDGDGMRSFAAALTWTPVPGLELVADTMDGLERQPVPLTGALPLAVPPLAFRAVVDGYARYELTPRLNLAVTFDYGRDASSGGVSFGGVGGYARLDLLDWLAGAVRIERYDDGDGFTSGAKQDLVEGTATLDAHGALDAVRWTGRLEYRRDQSDVAFFDVGAGGRVNHQDTLSVSTIATF